MAHEHQRESLLVSGPSSAAAAAGPWESYEADGSF
jgi:hypothetical protein